jgi:hypothetical protein
LPPVAGAWFDPNGWPINPVLDVTNKLADKGAIESPKGLPPAPPSSEAVSGVGLTDMKPVEPPVSVF